MAFFVLFLTIFVSFVKWQPGMLSFGSTSDLRIDASALIFMNYWFDLGPRYGTDIVFPYGPYQFVRYGLYWPGLLAELTFGRVLVATALVLVFWQIMTVRKRIAVTKALVLGMLMIWAVETGTDAPFTILLLALVYLQAIDPRPRLSVATAVAAVAIGLVSLTKFPFFLLFVAAVVVGAAIDRVAGRRPYVAVISMGSMLAFWFLAGQGLDDVWPWISSSFELASGFNESMSMGFLETARLAQVLLFLATIAGLVGGHLWLSRTWREERVQQLLVLLFVGPWSWVVMKHGIVRHDAHAGHAAASFVLAVVVFLLAFPIGHGGPLRWRVSLAGGLLALGTGNLLLAHLVLERHPTLGETPAILVRNARQMVRFPTTAKKLRLRHDEEVARFRALAGDLPSSGTLDVWPDNNALAVFSGAEYRPRPMSHAYSSYSLAMTQANSDFLEGPAGPDHMVFEIETIDRRLPTLDDPWSWLSLLSHYDPVDEVNSRLVLKRRVEPRRRTETEKDQRVIRWGETLDLGGGHGEILWARVAIKQTLAGRLVTFLYKAPPVFMALTTRDGQSSRYRVIPDTATVGFLLSPRLALTGDFLDLFESGVRDRAKDVASVRFELPRFTDALYRDSIDVRLSSVQLTPGLSLEPEAKSRLESLGRLARLEQRATHTGVTEVRLMSVAGIGPKVLIAHAPNELSIDLTGGERRILMQYGMLPASYSAGAGGDGTSFRLIAESADGERQALFVRHLKPNSVKADRGMQNAEIELPGGHFERLLLVTDPGPNGDTSWDQSYWAEIVLD